MGLIDVKQKFHNSLDTIFGHDEVKNFFYLTIEHFHKINRTQWALNTDIELTQEDEAGLLKVLKDLKNQKPIQYILGHTEFYGMPFKVDKNVLIPRPETEELVHWIIQVVKSKGEKLFKNPIKILDIGTGSGCIAIALAKHLPNAEVFALDISNGSIRVAKDNAQLNNVDIKFLQCDILNWEKEEALEGSKFDIIVSNPPYVRYLEKKEMKSNVLDYEPHLALFVKDDDALIFYKAIIEFAMKAINA